MMNASPKISRLHKGDLPSLLALSQQAGWPHTVRDWTAVLECGTGYGHRRYGSADDNDVVSGVHVTDYGKQFASLGLMVVDESYRGQGMGKALLKDVLLHIPPSQSVGLIAGATVSSFYEPFGFRSIEEERILVLRKETSLSTPAATVVVPDASPQHTLRSVSPENLKEVLDFDLQATGLERRKLVQHRLSHADRSLMYTSIDGTIKGYGMANVQEGSLTIGPLVSLDTQTALQMTLQLAGDHGSKYSNNEAGFPPLVRIDAYKSQSEFVDGLVNMGYQVAPEQRVMIKGPLLSLPGNRNHIYAPASQAWM